MPIHVKLRDMNKTLIKDDNISMVIREAIHHLQL